MARDELDPIKAIVIVIVLIAVFYEIVLKPVFVGIANWFNQNWIWIVIIIVVIVVGVFGFLIWIGKESEVEDAESEKRRLKEEQHRKEEELAILKEKEECNKARAEEERLARSIIKTRLLKERASELDDLNQKQKKFLLNKWIEEEYQKEYGEPETPTEPEPIPRIPIPNKLKRAIFRAYGSRCAMCGRQEPLRIHHINGNRSDNNPRNLIPVCGTCHDKNFPKEQYKARWKPPKYIK